jgi:tryptophanyl-tRNA synthetase
VGGKGYGEFKKQLFEAIWLYFEPMRRRRAELEADPQRLDAILADGARRASIVAEQTLSRVRAAVGLPAC